LYSTCLLEGTLKINPISSYRNDTLVGLLFKRIEKRQLNIEALFLQIVDFQINQANVDDRQPLKEGNLLKKYGVNCLIKDTPPIQTFKKYLSIW